LDIEEAIIAMTLDHMLKENDVIFENPDAIYLPRYFIVKSEPPAESGCPACARL